MNLFEKIDGIVDYSNKKELYEYNKYDIFELSTMLKKLTKEEKEKVFLNLDKQQKDELKKLEEGGLL